jgi:hypothetical protein
VTVAWSTLQRGKGLRRGTELARTGRLSPVSAKRAAAGRHRRSRPETGFPRGVKAAVRERAGGGDIDEARCEATGAWLGRHGGEIQHRDARGMGGSKRANTIVNAALLAAAAHRLAEARDGGMNERGWWLRNGQDPALTPVTLWDGRVVLLTPDGGYAGTAREAA